MPCLDKNSVARHSSNLILIAVAAFLAVGISCAYVDASIVVPSVEDVVASTPVHCSSSAIEIEDVHTKLDGHLGAPLSLRTAQSSGLPMVAVHLWNRWPFDEATTSVSIPQLAPGPDPPCRGLLRPPQQH